MFFKKKICLGSASFLFLIILFSLFFAHTISAVTFNPNFPTCAITFSGTTTVTATVSSTDGQITSLTQGTTAITTTTPAMPASSVTYSWTPTADSSFTATVSNTGNTSACSATYTLTLPSCDTGSTNSTGNAACNSSWSPTTDYTCSLSQSRTCYHNTLTGGGNCTRTAYTDTQTTNTCTTHTGYSCNASNQCILSAPTISTTLTCITNGYTGTGYTISWTNPATPVTYIDISTSDAFTTYYHKEITGSATSTNGTGFNLSTGGGTSLTYNPNTTYYARLYNGTGSVNNRATAPFTTPSLPAAQTPPSCSLVDGTVPDGSCGTTSYTANCSTSCNSGACIPPTPTITTSNITNSCINDGYNGSGISISWTNNTTPATAVDISTDSNFTTFYNRYDYTSATAPDPKCTNLSFPSTSNSSVTAPSGFYRWDITNQRQNCSQSLTLNPNTTYYVRLWDGTNHSLNAEIPSISACCTTCSSCNLPETPQCSIDLLTGTCKTSGTNCTSITASCQNTKLCTDSSQRCVSGNCVYSAWIQTRGDVHSNTKIKAPGGP